MSSTFVENQQRPLGVGTYAMGMVFILGLYALIGSLSRRFFPFQRELCAAVVAVALCGLLLAEPARQTRIGPKPGVMFACSSAIFLLPVFLQPRQHAVYIAGDLVIYALPFLFLVLGTLH